MTVEPQSDPLALRERAGDLLEYLRTTPEGFRCKSTELAAKYGLPPEVVERLLETVRPKRNEFRMPWLKPLGSAASGLKQLGRALCRAPYWAIGLPVLPGILLTFLAAPAALARFPALSALLVSLVVSPALDLGIYYTNRRSREVVFGAVVQAIACGYVFCRVPLLGTPWSDPFTLFLIFALGGGVAHLALGEIVLLIGTLVARDREAEREMMLSRQELLSRYFDLQARLSVAHLPVKKRRPIRDLFQRYPFWIALVAVLIDNLPARVLMRQTGFDAGNPSALLSHDLQKVLVIVLVCTALSVVEWIVIGALAATADKFRSVWWICFGCLLGELGFGLALPVKGVAPMFSGEGLTSLALGLITYFVPISLIFIGFKLHRDHQTKKRAEQGDADAILGELLDVQWRLASAPTDVYVLVVDVVGSTRMKAGADVLNTEYSFGAYQAWVNSVVMRYGGRIEATAGDSAIAAFGGALEAVAAGKELLGKLDDFNQTSNRLPKPFQVRIALHMGRVLANLTHVQYSHVIDVAAHVEKVSPVNGMALTQSIVELLDPSLTASLERGPEVDGISTYLRLSS